MGLRGISKALVIASAVMLPVSSVAAAAGSAVEPVRASAALEDESNLVGADRGMGGWLIPLVAILAIIAGIIAATGGDDEDRPLSPG